MRRRATRRTRTMNRYPGPCSRSRSRARRGPSSCTDRCTARSISACSTTSPMCRTRSHPRPARTSSAKGDGEALIMPVLVDLDPQSADVLVRRLGPNAMALSSLAELDRYLVSFPTESVVVLAPSVPLVDSLDFAERMRVERPTLGVILVRERFDSLMLSDALRAGVREVVARADLDELRAAAWRAAELASRLQPTRQLVGVGQDAGGAPGDGLVVTVFSAKGGCGK